MKMPENVKIAIITVLKQSEYFSLQLDESTDVAGEANLLAFVRFELNGNIEEEMLFVSLCRQKQLAKTFLNLLIAL